ncbi:Signal recognition particle receptor subunit alpha-like protein [Rhodotorula toruloides]|uniref:BY PROTMAP: gi/472583254/gb/EMS20897.1/ signal recognition particle binding protein [Rhodosporidium toruloides NP11] gi/647401756/emb/CDR48111.1/ RHTO0S16e01486g1_1 [Rhodosporidium toruloides] n=1 Tax=Rhodotorula toruloides TaxID=5286 RepID=A0A0K3CDH7_RHOTO|nr:Signal recognition particle receptor subunit alpha-like protein [Rhodotorula toruloides]
MLDHCSILTQGGLVLWERSFTPSASPFDTLIREALIEQRSTSTTTTTAEGAVSRWDKDAHSLLWLLANDLDLVLCVAYQRILSLPYVADLLEAIRRAFLKAYRETVEAIVESTRGKDVLVLGGAGGGKAAFGLFGQKGWQKVFAGWDETFNRILRDFEANAAKNKKTTKTRTAAIADSPSSSPGDSEATTPSLASPSAGETLDAQTIARNIAALKARQKAAQKGKAGGRRSMTPGGTESEGGGSESDATPTKPRARKAATKWSDSPITEADLAAYDYSSDAPGSPAPPGTPQKEVEVDTKALVDRGAMGKRDAKSGLYEVAEYAVGGGSDDEDDEDDGAATAAQGATSALGSFFSRLSLSPRALTAADLAPILSAMQQHLMSKNVAKDIAEQVVQSVGKSLEGKKVSSGSGLFGGGAGKKAVREAMHDALVRILTPKTSTDLLLEIQRKRSASNAKGAVADPYAITFVGVNGVGKSTNLSKVAFWLLQNRLRVLIAACDTFRSGAVEQLRVHVRNLGKLEEELEGEGAAKRVELFEKGYGKDAAGIAKDALAYAKQQGFDVVLIDTAGRMQDNEPLMRALAKLIAVNQPDKIIFVGEALVGNEAVDQLTKFNRALRDFSGSAGVRSSAGAAAGEGRGVDGMILTKFDTIDDKVGAALSMTYVSGQPIYFVGTGQTYSDLRMLRVGHIVQALLQD